MEDQTTEHLEHAEHAEHASHEANPFIMTVSVTIAILAVIAATIGSLETVESGRAISEKNAAVLSQNLASDQYAYYQSKALKQTMYEIAANNGEPGAAASKAAADHNAQHGKEIVAKAQGYEKQRDEKLAESDSHENRHHILTIGVTLVHVAIAVATVAIITRGQRWPWLASIVLTALGVAVSAYAYVAH